MGRKRNIFLTGVTGFIGSHFAGTLVAHLDGRGQDYELLVLSRSKGEIPYDQRVKLPINARQKARFIEGDITKPEFGMCDDDLRMVQECQEVWHMAASTEFTEKKREQTFTINTQGTRNAVQIFENAPNLERFFYVGTAYVGGLADVVMEDELKIPEMGFKNVYEESKFHAEKAVRSSELPYIVLRPSIVIGDSETGKADDKTVYGVMASFARAKQMALKKGRLGPNAANGFNFVVHGRYATTKNFIPCNDVIHMMLLIRDKGKVGSCYHMANPIASTFGALCDSMERMLGVAPSTYTKVAKEKDHVQRIINSGIDIYGDYVFVDDPEIDMKNMNALMKGRRVTEVTPNVLDFLAEVYFKSKGYGNILVK